MIRQILVLIISLALAACDKPSSSQKTASSPATGKPVAEGTTPAATPAAPSPARYAGSEQCQLCHVTQQQDWLHSDHHRAMTLMDKKYVLGDFSAPPLQHHGQQTRFSNDNGKYRIFTDENSAKGSQLDLEYTFGFFPLQQYLTALPGGRWQSLPFAWDSRPVQNWGQRWFHLYADEKIVPGDALHWQSPSHNANHMCIECHTTNFVKNFNPDTESFQSTWQEIGVGCESCHGPGSRHIAWAHSSNKSAYGNKGWDQALTSGSMALWQHQGENRKPHRIQPADSSQVEQCAQCHSRRSRIHESNHEKHLLDAFMPSLLDEGLYHADGQILEEVYEYGSFLQSRMANSGVTCSNCHNPHSGKPKIDGNGLCLQCHSNDYDNQQHTLHAPSSKGSFCVDCHMPAKNYMTVDARRDHSLRIPRPDLTISIGTPNACNDCHNKQSPEWAAKNLDEKSGVEWRKPHYGETLSQARRAMPASYDAVVALINDAKQSAIIRGTAISLLQGFSTRDYRAILHDMSKNTEPLIRLGVLRAAETLPPDEQGFLMPLLADPQRTIRIEAARLLAGNPAIQGSNEFSRARQEYIDSQQLNADRAASLTNLANIAIREGRIQDAESLLLTAIKREPYFIPASINLADLYRMTNRDQEAEKILLEAINSNSDSSDLYFSYGLWLVRNQQPQKALAQLQKASQQGDDPHYKYVYALALQQAGDMKSAQTQLDEATTMSRYNRDVMMARVDLAWRQNDTVRAGIALREWKDRDSQDPLTAKWEKLLESRKP